MFITPSHLHFLQKVVTPLQTASGASLCSFWPQTGQQYHNCPFTNFTTPPLSFLGAHLAHNFCEWAETGCNFGAQFKSKQPRFAQKSQRFGVIDKNIVYSWGSYYNSQYCTKIIAFFLRSRLLWPLSRFIRSACYFLAHIFSARPPKSAVYLLYFQKLSFHSFSRFSCSER